MNDRELLGLAAKAWIRSGMRLECPDDDGGIYVCRDQSRNGHTWNPLTDDGDALRLAVKLGIEFYSEGGEEDYAIWANCEMIYVDDHDPCEVTRRAIVRAAAAIGEAMQ